MSSQNNEFEIPFSLSRRGRKEEINTKAIGRRIGSAAGRLVDRPNLGGGRRPGARGLGMPDGDLDPRTRIDVDGDGTIFDGWPGWEQPDPTPSAPELLRAPSLASGKKDKGPSFPRKPTYGPFLGEAEKRFGNAKTWEEFKEIYDDTEVVFFDYETTGLVFDEFREPSANGMPVQFGVVKMKGNKEVSRLNLFMNPREPLGQWSLDNLKDKDGKPLTDQWLAQQMSIEEAHRALVDFVGEGAIFGVQNAAYDKDVLEQTLSDAGIDWRPAGYLDTKDIADMSLPKWSEDNQDGPFTVDSEGNKKASNGLAAITKYLEVDLGAKHHTADADAEATGLVMSAIINGALERDWPPNLLDAKKRSDKLTSENKKFAAEVEKFRQEKQKYLDLRKSQESPSLSSGSKERPIIKINKSKERPVISFKKDERELLKKHRSKKYKYGDKSELGGEIKASKTDWLKGLSSEQISELIVPDSQDAHYRMWVDDIAPGAYETPTINEAFRKYYDEMMANSPWDDVDYSPSNVQASRDAVRELLDSSPAVKWAFEKHGAPSIGVMSDRGVKIYEEQPSISSKLDDLQKTRGLDKRPFVRARLSPATNLLIFNKRAIIDREGSAPGEETSLLWSDVHMPLITDAHIDKSIGATMVHEWGHWLVFRAVKDTEQTKKNRTNFFGSGDLNDDNYIRALALSEYYSQTEKNDGLMDLWEKKVPIEDSKEIPRVLTSYGHVNEAETFAEGVVAYFHPNKEVRKNAINQKLRDDIEVFLGDGDGKKPWDDNESIELALSSGRTSRQRLEKREINSISSEQAFSSMPEDDRELARLDYFLSLSSGAIIPESGSRKLEIINDFDDRKNDNFATPIRVVSFKDSNGKDVEYTIFATGKFGDSVYVFEKTKLDKYVSEKEEMISLANGVPFEEVGISVISTMTDEREIRDKKNGLVGVMSVMPPSGDGETSVVHEIAIDDKHKRRGLASALFKYHRDSWPDQDLHHSSALSDDGRAFAAATPFDGTSNPPVGNLQNDLSNFVSGLMEVIWDPSKDNDNDNDISLSSGAKYAEIVKRQPNPSREQIDSSRNFKDFVQLDELRKDDVWVTTGVDIWGDETSELADSEDRANIKKDIKQSIETLFSYEIELDDSIVITSNSGEKINLGNKIKITAVVEDVQVSSLEEKDISEQMDEIGHMLIGGDKKPLTRVDIKFKISPADSAATEKLLALGVPEGLIDIDNPKTNIELGRAHRVIFTDGSKTVVSHESMSVGKDARRKGLASEFNARNESLYREIDADSIITQGVSSSTVDQIGATHWARNGFSLLGEPSKQRFIGVIDDAITNKPESFSEEERKRISSLYKKDKKTGKFTSSATAEELIDFTEADEIFRIVEDNSGIGLFFGTGIFFTREVAKSSGINKVMNRMRRRVGSERTDSSSPSLSSGAFDYRGLHGAPGRGSGAPLHDLISADYSVYPEDVYSSNAIKYYGVGDDNLDATAFNLIRSFKGKPNAEVTIYRAVPTSSETRISRLEKEKAHIMKYGKVPKSAVTNLGPSEYYEKISNEIDELKNNPEKRISVSAGDWVTPFRQYAVMHGDGALRGDYEIVKKRVKAKNVYTDGNSWLEWGYDDSKGSLSLSSGEQPKINLSDDEKREIIRLASQRTDSFSRSVVAQYHRNNGKLSNKQWASLNRMTSRGALGLSSGMVSDEEILTRVAKSFERASLPDEPSTPIDQRLISKMVSGLKKKDGTPVSINDFLSFLSKIADIQDEDGIHPGFNDLEEQILPIDSLADIFKELGHSRIDVPGSRTKKILGPVVREMVDLIGDDEFLEDARQYALPPLEVWARAAAKSILQIQEFGKDVGEPRREFMTRKFSIESLDGINSFVLRGIGGEIIMSAPVDNMTQRDRREFQYSNLNEMMFTYRQQTPGIPFMTMVKRHLYPNDPLAEVLADRRAPSSNNNAATGGRNMAEGLEYAILTPLDVFKFSDSPSGRRMREIFERAYTDVAHYDEFSRRYAIRVRKLLSDAGLDPDSPEVKRALTTGWTQIADATEEPPENGGRFISAALLVRNLVAGLYRPSWDMAGEAYTTPHEFMHLLTGQGFTRHGEMASNIGWLGAFGKDVWPKVSTLLNAQAPFFNLQKEDSAGGDLNKGDEKFKSLVLNEIRELLGGDGDDYGSTSSALMTKLYEKGGILSTAETDELFKRFNWIDSLIPLEASDLGWGLKFGQPKEDEGLSLSSGALNRKPTKKNITDGKKVLERLKNDSYFSENGESLDNMYARGAVVSSEKIVNAENRDIARDIVLDAERNMNSWKAEEESARNSGMAGYVYEAEGMRDGARQTFTAMYGPLTTVTEYRRENRGNRSSSSPSLSSGANGELNFRSRKIDADIVGSVIEKNKRIETLRKERIKDLKDFGYFDATKDSIEEQDRWIQMYMDPEMADGEFADRWNKKPYPVLTDMEKALDIPRNLIPISEIEKEAKKLGITIRNPRHVIDIKVRRADLSNPDLDAYDKERTRLIEKEESMWQNRETISDWSDLEILVGNLVFEILDDDIELNETNNSESARQKARLDWLRVEAQYGRTGPDSIESLSLDEQEEFITLRIKNSIRFRQYLDLTGKFSDRAEFDQDSFEEEDSIGTRISYNHELLKKKPRKKTSAELTREYERYKKKKENEGLSLSSGANDSELAENFTSPEAIKKIKQATEILDRIAPDGDILQKVLELRESESQKLSVGSNLPLTDKEVEFIGDVVSAGKLINEAIEEEFSKSDDVGALRAKFLLLRENMLTYAPVLTKLVSSAIKEKEKRPISVVSVIHGVPENSKGLDSLAGDRSESLYPQFNADLLISLIKTRNQGLGVNNYVLGLSETVPTQVDLIWQEPLYGNDRGPKISIRANEQPKPGLHTPKIILRTNRNESRDSDLDNLELVRENLPLVRDVQQLLRNVRKALVKKVDYETPPGYRFSDKEILDMATRTTFLGEMEDFIPNHREHRDALGQIRELSYIGDKDRANLTWRNILSSVETYGEKPNDEIWIRSAESDDVFLSEQQLHPPHKFRMRFNPITEEYSIELIEAAVHGKDENFKSNERIIDADLAEFYLRETILRHVQSLRLSKEQKQELFIEKYREVLASKKVAKAFDAVAGGQTIKTEMTINGEVYPVGTKLSILETAWRQDAALHTILQEKIEKSDTGATGKVRKEIIKKALQAVGVEFTEPKEVPIFITQLKRMQQKLELTSWLRRTVGEAFDGTVDEKQRLRAMEKLEWMENDRNDYSYKGKDAPEILARLEEIVSIMPKALTDGSLSGSLADTQYDTRDGAPSQKAQGDRGAQAVGAPLRLFYRVVPKLARAHATNLHNGATLITQERPEDETEMGWMSTALHEAFHGVENSNPVIKVLEWMFWRSRKKSDEEVMPLREMPKGAGYGFKEHEVGVIDNWGHVYAGKIYNNFTGTTTGGPLENFEILTTGVQAIFYPQTSTPTLGDKEHMGFAMGILALARKTKNNESNEGLSLSSGANDKFQKQLKLIDEAVSRSSSRGVVTSSYKQDDITPELVEKIEKEVVNFESEVESIREKIEEEMEKLLDSNKSEKIKDALYEQLDKERDSISKLEESARIAYLALRKIKSFSANRERDSSSEWTTEIHISRDSAGRITGIAVTGVQKEKEARGLADYFDDLADVGDGKALYIDYMVSFHREKDSGRTLLGSILDDAQQDGVSLVQIEPTDSSSGYWDMFGFTAAKQKNEFAINGPITDYFFLKLDTAQDTEGTN